MGDARVTVQNLTIARVDAENNLLMVRGAVPGPNGGLVIVKKA
jgi:large subunit ribosomal protein L3